MAMARPALSTAQIRQAVDRLPRFALGHFPTPLERLDRLSRALGGPTIHIKRDDCTGLAFGGNKTRHNEFLLGKALEDGCDLFVWGAGVQSNNCRQTAAACAKAGLDCHLVLGRGANATGPVAVQGNLLLDHLLGASYEIVPDTIGAELDERIAERAAAFAAQGRRVFKWDRDTVKPLAAVSYVLCLLEIVEQSQQAKFDPAAIYLSSAGSTGSGVALGAALIGSKVAVKNICPIQWEWDTQADMARIANEAADVLRVDARLDRADIDLTFDYIGPGYGKTSPAGLEAMALLARTEGILIEPIYTAKAMAGLIDDIRKGRFRDTDHVVFLHTGGTPALFAYNDELAAGIAPRQL